MASTLKLPSPPRATTALEIMSEMDPVVIAFVVILATTAGVAMSRLRRRGGWMRIPDKYTDLPSLRRDLHAAGFEGASVVVGIDCTASNESMGMRTFGGRSLHSVSRGQLNPYEAAMVSLIETLSSLDTDGQIPMYGFGSADTADRTVFSFGDGGGPCEGLSGVLAAYRAKIGSVRLAGPTSFAPLVHRTIELARENPGEHHVLIICTDGTVNDGGRTEAAVREASRFRISIIAVGVGDGDGGGWDKMERLDDRIRGRHFDNFQFVRHEMGMDGDKFALGALMELPDQFIAARRISSQQ